MRRRLNTAIVTFGPPIHFARATGEELAHSDASIVMLFAIMAAGKSCAILPTLYPHYADIFISILCLEHDRAEKG